MLSLRLQDDTSKGDTVTSSSRVQAVVQGINVVLLSVFPQAGNKTKSAKLFFWALQLIAIKEKSKSPKWKVVLDSAAVDKWMLIWEVIRLHECNLKLLV